MKHITQSRGRTSREGMDRASCFPTGTWTGAAGTIAACESSCSFNSSSSATTTCQN